MADPVAAKSGFLCMYMSNHPDTLVAYVRHWGKVNDDVAGAQMTSIDTKGMSLSYQNKINRGVMKEVRVEFDPPLAGYEEVKPRLLSMKVDAEEALGMAKAPQITSFRFPRDAWMTTALIVSLIYVTWAPEPSAPNFSTLWHPGYFTRSILPSWIVPFCWYIILLPAHTLEALYALSICWKHSTPLLVGAAYVFGTFVWGFPVLGELRRQKHAVRIDSILKGK
ncbi:uncharacterized protein LAESUDRAFT_662836 [Laetiporus sulphureus 93-53]|uniref:DUF2470 domain-containing protein n=1 Tax=Laetiporus sulphureus 93-53 TaxID=1314785 RepID=A0A165C0C2_9APHY|nr:uncharacterized protein LAESUDRAFT_662836 [Laetiporus sulphureus 93-53]KZT01970.1 hypothetical protein LAESUDRAFT_662836 [Laetiporus sulphureus 93-53]